MKRNYTHISIVLDKSGSMDSIKDDTIGGFNSFVKDQRKVKGEATLTLRQFNGNQTITHEFENINEIPLLTKKTFVPSGVTALLDAIGFEIDLLGNKLKSLSEEKRPEKVIVVIITDGYENSSTKYKHSAITEKISHQKNNYNWEFVFLGADQDAIASASKFGISPDKAMSYAKTKKGIFSVYDSISANITNFRAGKDYEFSFKECDYSKQAKELKKK